MIKVWIDPVKLHSHDLTAVKVQQAIQRQNFSLPGGVVERGPNQVTVRVEGKVTNLDQLRRRSQPRGELRAATSTDEGTMKTADEICCSACGARYRSADWRGLVLSRRMSPDDLRQQVLGWPEGRCVEVRAC